MKAKLVLSFLAFSSLGCDDETVLYREPYQEYEEGSVTVIGGDPDAPVATGTTEGDCLQITEDTCTPIVRDGMYCKTDSGPVDVIVVNGMVQEVVCYEDTTGDGPTEVVQNGSGGVDVPQQDNGSVITFDPSTDGVPIEGDVRVDGNNVTIYGNGPDKTIITGNLDITGNNARVRGVRVKGNVTIDLNTASFVLSVVEGNLEVSSNNCLVAENDAFGNVQVSGNNTILVGNDVDDQWQIQGSGSICQSNRSFDDTNGDAIVAETERGATDLTCP
jgi:hypothetical protein